MVPAVSSWLPANACRTQVVPFQIFRLILLMLELLTHRELTGIAGGWVGWAACTNTRIPPRAERVGAARRGDGPAAIPGMSGGWYPVGGAGVPPAPGVLPIPRSPPHLSV